MSMSRQWWPDDHDETTTTSRQPWRWDNDIKAATWRWQCQDDDVKTTVIKKKKLNNIIPDTIPLKPERFYKGKGWVNFKDFIGAHQYFGYNQAKKIIKKHNIKSAKEFAENHRNNKFPKQMPYSPSYFYKKTMEVLANIFII